MKQIIGLTGPTGAGKSTAVLALKNTDITVIDCDKRVHEILVQDTDCKRALTVAFGEDILVNGEIDRGILASRAFETKEKTELLNSTVFPFVLYHILNDISSAESNTVLLDAPTLFESGIDELCCATVAVLADEETRLDRILKRDNITKENAFKRISAGKTDDFYKSRANYIIINSGDTAALQAEFRETIEKIMNGGK